MTGVEQDVSLSIVYRTLPNDEKQLVVVSLVELKAQPLLPVLLLLQQTEERCVEKLVLYMFIL